ncbi:MAG: response regulator [Desulfococcaceae bacterium]
MHTESNRNHSLSRSFMRDWLAAFIPSILLLILAAGIIFRGGIVYFTELMETTTHELNEYAGEHLRLLGEQFIQTKAKDVANQVAIYLQSCPDISMQELRKDQEFQKIAIQLVGKSGYTCLYEAHTGITRIHPNPSLIDYQMSLLSEKLPSFWAIFRQSLSGIEIAGYYDWQEPDGRIREKYMAMSPVGLKFHDTELMIAATTYIDEFSAPVADMNAKSSEIRVKSQKFIFRQSLIFGIAGVLIVFLILFSALWLARRVKYRYIQPVEQLAAAAGELGQGRWDAAGLDTMPDRNDEIGQLAKAFLNTVTKLRELFTEQEKRTAELRESEEKFRIMFEDSNDAILIIDQNRFVDCNNATVQMLRYPGKEKLLQTHPSELSPEKQPDGRLSYEKAEEMMTMAVKTGSHRFEWMHRRSDGEEFPVEVSLTLVPYKGRTLIHTTWRDITERKKAEEELRKYRMHLEELVQERTAELKTANEKMQNEIAERERAEAAISESEQRLADIIDFLPDPTFVIDKEGRIIAWNKAIAHLTGKSAQDMLGKGNYEYGLAFYGERRPILVDLVHISDEELRKKYSNIRRIGNALIGEALIGNFKDKGNMWFIGTASVLYDSNGNAAGAIESVRDITERRLLEEHLKQAKDAAEAANRAKSAFLATMSHEIRTPMNGVIGMTGLLLNTDLTKEQRMFAETIRNSGESLLTIINDILDFSKIEAGQMELEKVPFRLRECVESALDLVSMKAGEKGLELVSMMDPDLPDAIAGDETRVRQILLNLLSNAVKFTQKGEILVSVSGLCLPSDSAGETAAKNWELHFAVKDSGIGIPSDRMDRLFKSFSQVDSSTSRKYGGTGLGLVISRRLAEMMGGAMVAESKEGVGTIFHFSIRAQAAVMSKLVYMRADQPSLRGRHVLIVDDNEINREILVRQTASWGMNPEAVPSGPDALKSVDSGKLYDLAILDMNMPEMDGIELAKKLHEERKSGKLPLVMMSSAGLTEKESYGEQKFAAWLLKPVKSSQLYNTLMEVFAENTVRPRVQEEDEQEPEYDSAVGEQHPLRILVAEDNSINQQLALLTLERLGYMADIAGNGLEAVDAVQRQFYDAVLMDVQMPEMDGLEATKQIRAKIPSDRQPHIIAMTANALQGDREMCLHAGMDDYVSKPFKVKELIRALRQCPSRGKSEKREESPQTADAANTAQSAEISVQECPAADLDPAALKNLSAMLGKKAAVMLPKLIDDFFRDAVKMQEQARQAMEQGKTEDLRRAVHTLKSNAKNFGATVLAQLCQKAENIAKSGSCDVSALLSQIETEYPKVRAALKIIK